MLSGDLCKRGTPRVELDQRAREIRLGLERVERLLVQRAGLMLPARGKPCHLGGVGTCDERPPHNPNFVGAERSPAFSRPNSLRWERCDNQVRTLRVVVIGGPHLPVPNNGGDR